MALKKDTNTLKMALKKDRHPLRQALKRIGIHLTMENLYGRLLGEWARANSPKGSLKSYPFC